MVRLWDPTRRADALVLWFFVAWTAHVLLVYPGVSTLPSPWNRIAGETARFAIFVVPTWLWIARLRPASPAPRSGWVEATAIAVPWALAAIGLHLSGGGELAWHRVDLGFALTAFTFSTWVEEVAFRRGLAGGWAGRGKAFALCASSIAFVGIHVPGWIAYDMLDSWTVAVRHVLSIGLLGLATGWLYLRHGSIWPGVLLHATNNLAARLIG